MSDGTFKADAVTSNDELDPPSASVSSSRTNAETQPPKAQLITEPKRRGRPPKDKSAIAVSTGRPRRASEISRLHEKVRPRSSLPTSLPKDVFASECVEAAYASRLDPYALHPSEHRLLVNVLMNTEVTVYLNIRNALLRLWLQNPLCSVTVEEAAGCAKDGRFFGLAEVAYKWLVRHGYINFGCTEVPRDPTPPKKTASQKTVVVIGAGVAGLTTARQLEGLFAQQSERWTDIGERPPHVVVLEGRKRIGGRVYSKPLRSQSAETLPQGLRNTVEMGAMIVTGFEHGNPLDTVIRGQLGLAYHLMTDELTIYDCDGKAIDQKKDMINTELYTDISDRAGEYRAMAQNFNTLKGDEELIDRARDPIAGGYENFQLEPLIPLENAKPRKPVLRRGRRRNAPSGTEKLTGRSRVIEESDATLSAARAAKTMGWQLKEGIAKNQSISLHKVARSSAYPTLGAVMDEAIEQYRDLIDLTAQDMRLLNWHHANLEYANAAPVSSLSLSGHDQDTGNEFEGAHSEIIGGYSQLPIGLMTLPTQLDVRFERVVDSIHYKADSDDKVATKVVCTNGEVYEADEVIITTPLGVLKSDMVDFDPPLPDWKYGAIDRLGFGLLNKLVLLYDKAFWDNGRDMFGLLNEAERRGSLDPDDYAKSRGRFYLIWNATMTSGRPMLVALMSGHSAHEAEQTDTNTLLADINRRLRDAFGEDKVPAPIEVIVTRWKRDPFTRGTYSYVAPETRPGDYDLMAEPVGNLHFAGEATCGTHPATVHGAFLSGLRVAADVMTSLAGPVTLPTPLVGSSPVKTEKPAGPPQQSVCPSDNSFWVQPAAHSAPDFGNDSEITNVILSQIGERPVKPKRPGVNPFLLWTKANWEKCKNSCSSNNPSAGRDAIRATLGQWWRAASEVEKEPYMAESRVAQEVADKIRREWDTKVQEWDLEARRIRKEYATSRLPLSGAAEHSGAIASVALLGLSKRRTNTSSCVVLDRA
ncbi:hypothetical protein BAUCODRAFT_72520 [Baudoinia panamericana UAMH 10762]|uniref:SWIRM domain-containing protein n=1 Tax=Baudoinia panamericana (strain UAMH 10762) TaxID=717646 RepID=M2LLV0_BAUPA|nr:uncharacterized protein BAUCODRAFT_72520 [Baudoinia panamericana UAMH 10762]EMC95292.1 hypothetical protein BAUCODRAFT_72520 [Baudoinia panamericana UAMH 10762]